MSYHVKVVATGWAGFSGNLGGHQFKDGISVDPLPVRQIDRIAALVKCVFINEQGKEEPAGRRSGCPSGAAPQALVGVAGFLPGPILPFAGVAAGADGTIYVAGDGEGSILALRRS